LIAPDSDGFAEGELYLDDGESLIQNSTSDIRFKYDGNVLQMRGTFGYDPGTVKIATITLLGEAPVTKTLDLPLVGGFDILIKSLSSY
jgi:alpha-glucosidase